MLLSSNLINPINRFSLYNINFNLLQAISVFLRLLKKTINLRI